MVLPVPTPVSSHLESSHTIQTADRRPAPEPERQGQVLVTVAGAHGRLRHTE